MRRRVIFRIGLVVVLAAAVLGGGSAWGEEGVDFAKLRKGDPIEVNVGGKWVPAKFDKQHTEKVIIVRLEGADMAQLAFAEMVRLPATAAAAKGAKAATLLPRTWSDKTGKFKLYASLVRVEGDKVVLRRGQGGRQIAVALEKLSEADQKYVKSVEARRNGTAPASADPAEANKPKQAAKDDGEAKAVDEPGAM